MGRELIDIPIGNLRFDTISDMGPGVQASGQHSTMVDRPGVGRSWDILSIVNVPVFFGAAGGDELNVTLSLFVGNALAWSQTQTNYTVPAGFFIGPYVIFNADLTNPAHVHQGEDVSFQATILGVAGGWPSPAGLEVNAFYDNGLPGSQVPGNGVLLINEYAQGERPRRVAKGN